MLWQIGATTAVSTTLRGWAELSTWGKLGVQGNCFRLLDTLLWWSAGLWQQTQVWRGLEFSRSLLPQLVSVCLVSRDLLLEQMSTLTLGPSSANADSKTSTLKVKPRRKVVSQSTQKPQKASKGTSSVKQKCREMNRKRRDNLPCYVCCSENRWQCTNLWGLKNGN